MSLILLVALAAALSRWAGPFLVRATWVARAPRLAIAVWLVVSSAVILSGLLAGLTMLMYWDRAHDLVQGVWHFCFDALLGRDNLGAQAIAVTGLLIVAALLARLAVACVRLARRQRADRDRMRTIVQIAGLFRDATQQVQRLVEMRADDVAARRSDRVALARPLSA